ncbi:MAG: choice-of-anchor Q domain-containing protein [Ardenticatenaceae bacterium]
MKTLGVMRVMFLFVALILSAATAYVSPAQASGKTITVNSIADPGDGKCDKSECTLREAIAEASSGSTIKFDLPDKATIILDDKQLTINKNLTIDGSTAKKLTVSGGDKSRVFEITKGAKGTVTMKGFSIIDGDADGDGGAIKNSARLILSDMTVRGNDAEGDGGGIWNSGWLEVHDSTVQDNDTDVGSGGGIYNSKILILDNSTLRANEAKMDGGGIWNRYRMAINKSTIRDNKASGSGGGLFIKARSGDAIIIDSTFRANEASSGGGIANFGSLGIKDSKFWENESSGGAGAIFNDQEVVVRRSKFKNNRSGGSGGAIVNLNDITVEDSTFENNSSSRSAGALYSDGSMRLDDNIFTKNRAGQDGGAIWAESRSSINNTTISNNYAKRNGGGITIDAGIRINNSTITDNQADGEGGGLRNQSGVSYQNTIIAGNRAPKNSDCSDRRRSLSLGYNLVGKTCPTIASDLVLGKGDLAGLTIDDVLDKLADNGGPTETHALVKDSPAIDAGNPDGCTNSDGREFRKDQRGKKRTVDGDKDGKKICDIGSYEKQ